MGTFVIAAVLGSAGCAAIAGSRLWQIDEGAQVGQEAPGSTLGRENQWLEDWRQTDDAGGCGSVPRYYLPVSSRGSSVCWHAGASGFPHRTGEPPAKPRPQSSGRLSLLRGLRAPAVHGFQRREFSACGPPRCERRQACYRLGAVHGNASPGAGTEGTAAAELYRQHLAEYLERPFGGGLLCREFRRHSDRNGRGGPVARRVPGEVAWAQASDGALSISKSGTPALPLYRASSKTLDAALQRNDA